MKIRDKLSEKERTQQEIFEQLTKESITQTEAAKQLGFSERHVRRKLVAYNAEGATSLIHKARGKPSNHALDAELTRNILSIYKEKYVDCAPTFAAELLLMNDGITINDETLRLLLRRNGFRFKARKSRKSQHHRSWRDPKPCFGDMSQVDGSFHDWFLGRAPYCSLIGFVDDATGTVCHLMLAPHEDQSIRLIIIIPIIIVKHTLNERFRS